MTCNCTDKILHDFLCNHTPKCRHCFTRLDYKTHHSINCPDAVLCDSCGTNTQDPSVFHPVYCAYHIRCEFCGIVETLKGTIHNYGCPKWYHEYNQRRIENARRQIVDRTFNFNNFLERNQTAESHLSIPSLKHLRKKSEEVCVICLQKDSDIKTKCEHYYHQKCLEEWCKISQKCPLCRNKDFY